MASAWYRPNCTGITVETRPLAAGRKTERGAGCHKPDRISGCDWMLFPGASAGTLCVSDTKTNTVDAIQLTGLDPNTPITSLGSFGEVGLVNPVTGVVGMSLLSGLSAPHGLDFVAATSSAPEPSTWPMLLLGLGGLAMAAAGRRKKAASHLATAN